MAITSSVTKNLDNNYVQVEIQSKNRETMYYKVPENKADSFQKEYKKNSKKMPWINTGLTLGAIILAVFPMSLLTQKIEQKSLRMAIGVIAGIIGGVGSMYLGTEIESKSHKNLLKKYNAEKINYEEQKFPI